MEYIVLICILIGAVADQVLGDCDILNARDKFWIFEDTSIGDIEFVQKMETNWNISQPHNSFVTGFFMDTPTKGLWINITGNTDLDTPNCDAENEVVITLTCLNGTATKTLNVSIVPRNDHKPQITNTIGIPNVIRISENTTVLSEVLKFGGRVQDEDCPRQELLFSVFKPSIADSDNYLDGSVYFDIDKNGTLFLKKELDYETTICGIRSDARMFLDVIIKDGDGQQTKNELVFLVLDVDDEAPEFVDLTCEQKCNNCERTSYIGNVSYENKGEITVVPPIVAIEIEKFIKPETTTMTSTEKSTIESTGSVQDTNIHYYIRQVIPDVYENLFMIDLYDGNISLSDSFQNATKDSKREDFSVMIIIQAVSGRTMLSTKNATLNLTIIVPPETTTMETTTLEVTTTEEETTTIEETTTVVKTTEVKSTARQTTPPKQNSDSGEDYTVVIIVPIVVVILLLIFIVIIALCRRKSLLATKKQYNLDKTKKRSNNGLQLGDTHLNGTKSVP